MAAIVAPARSTPPLCRPSFLSLSRSEPLYEGSGVSGWVIRLTNRGAGVCRLDRRPWGSLLDRRRALPFAVAYHRRCVWFCDGKQDGVQPHWLVVPRSRSVFFAFSKYRCDGRTYRIAATVRLFVRSALRVRLPDYPVIGWCGSGDPGSTLDLSPFELTEPAAIKRT